MDKQQLDYLWAKDAVARFLAGALRGLAKEYETLARLYKR